MTPRPTIFISAVSRELKSARQLVANTLQFLGYEPVWQDIFGTEQGDLREMLRQKIDDSQGVVQLIGRRYGAEPPTADPQFGRVSYTQYEALYGKQRGKKVWYVIVGPEFPTDVVEPEPPELQALQDQYRQSLEGQSLYHTVDTSAAMEASILKLRNDLSRLRQGVKRWAVSVSACLVLLIGGVVWLITHENVKHDEVKDAYTDLERKLGVRLADVKPSDFHVSIEPAEVPSMVKVDLGMDDKYGPMMNYWAKSISFNDGPPQPYMMAMLPMKCDIPIDQIKSVKLQLQTQYEATHELEKCDPMTLVPTTKPASGLAAVMLTRRDPAAMAMQGAKTNVLAQKSFLEDRGSGYLCWTQLRYYFPAVKQIKFGGDPNHLDRMMEVHQPDAPVSSAMRSKLGNSYQFDYIPYCEGSPVYTQVELIDGTRTPVVQADLTRLTTRRAVQGIEATPASGQDPQLRLFASFKSGASTADFEPVVPDNTAKVLYTFDTGGYFPAKKLPTHSDSHLSGAIGFRFSGPLANGPVHLKFVLDDGTTVGPVSFELKNVSNAVADDLKSKFAADEENAVFAVNLQFAFPTAPKPAENETPQAESARVDQVRADWETSQRFDHWLIPHDVHAPSTLCEARKPDNVTWGAVKAIHFGTQSGQLDREIAVTYTPASTAADNRPKLVGLPVYFPPETTELYAQFTFADGTTSPEVRLRVISIDDKRLRSNEQGSMFNDDK